MSIPPHDAGSSERRQRLPGGGIETTVPYPRPRGTCAPALPRMGGLAFRFGDSDQKAAQVPSVMLLRRGAIVPG